MSLSTKGPNEPFNKGSSKMAKKKKLYKCQWATRNYCGVLKEHLIVKVLKGQNWGPTLGSFSTYLFIVLLGGLFVIQL